VNIREIATLEMENNELSASLEFEAKKHIPLDGTEAILDYHILGNNPKEIDKINVLLVATTRNTINAHAEIVKDAGFKPGVFNSDPVALINTYLENKGLPKEGVDVLLNIGNQHTSVIVWGKDMPLFTRELQIAGHEFTKAIAKAQGVDYATAETVKLEKGIEALNSDNSNEDDGVLSIKVAEKTVFTGLADEIRKTLRYYIKTNSQAFFNKFYISGGSATVPGLKPFLADLLKVEIELFNPFENVSSDKEVSNPAQYAVAMGLAITGNEKE
jgi:type IV pilus assembly protein PilM